MTTDEQRSADRERAGLRVQSHHELFAAVTAIIASEHNRNLRSPAAFDDAEDELHDDILLAAARRFCEARKDVELPTYLVR